MAVCVAGPWRAVTAHPALSAPTTAVRTPYTSRPRRKEENSALSVASSARRKKQKARNI